MYFRDLFHKSCVCIDDNAQSKTALFYKISQLLSHPHSNLTSDELFDALWQRESLGSTGIGHGVIVPHIRSANVSKACACFIKLNHPVYFGGDDKQPIDLVAGLVRPQDSNKQHLEILKAIIKPLSNAAFRAACRQANDNKTLYSLLMQHTQEIILTCEEIMDD